MEAALGRKTGKLSSRKVTGEVEAKDALQHSEAPEGYSRWTMQAIADELS